MKALFEAIKTEYDGSALASSTQGLFIAMVPPETALPYITLDLISKVPDRTFGENFEECVVQFTVWVGDENLS